MLHRAFREASTTGFRRGGTSRTCPFASDRVVHEPEPFPPAWSSIRPKRGHTDPGYRLDMTTTTRRRQARTAATAVLIACTLTGGAAAANAAPAVPDSTATTTSAPDLPDWYMPKMFEYEHCETPRASANSVHVRCHTSFGHPAVAVNHSIDNSDGASLQVRITVPPGQYGVDVATYNDDDIAAKYTGIARESRYVEQWTTSAPFDFGRHPWLNRTAGTAVLMKSLLFTGNGSDIDLVIEPRTKN